MTFYSLSNERTTKARQFPISTVFLIVLRRPHIDCGSKCDENDELRDNTRQTAAPHKDRTDSIDEITKRIDKREMTGPVGHTRNGSKQSAEEYQTHYQEPHH